MCDFVTEYFNMQIVTLYTGPQITTFHDHLKTYNFFVFRIAKILRFDNE